MLSIEEIMKPDKLLGTEWI